MFNPEFIQELEKSLELQVLLFEPLSKYTTIGVGGPADYLITVNSVKNLELAIRLANKFQIPIFILGGGSNIIINDSGFHGLVIRNQLHDFKILSQDANSQNHLHIESRLEQIDHTRFYQANADSSFNQSTQKVRIQVGSGWKLAALMQQCLEKEITGLEWFSGIPGSVGGAVYMNAHGGNYFFSDFLESIDVITLQGELKTYDYRDLKFDYDYSLLHKTKDIVLRVTLELYKGDVRKAREIMKSWGSNKITKQPQRSAGCIFQNLSLDQQKALGLPTSSIGFIIDRILGLSGKRIGDAVISPKHSGFIENLGSATARDVISLVQLVETSFTNKFGINLVREIEVVGESIY